MYTHVGCSVKFLILLSDKRDLTVNQSPVIEAQPVISIIATYSKIPAAMLHEINIFGYSFKSISKMNEFKLGLVIQT